MTHIYIEVYELLMRRFYDDGSVAPLELRCRTITSEHMKMAIGKRICEEMSKSSIDPEELVENELLISEAMDIFAEMDAGEWFYELKAKYHPEMTGYDHDRRYQDKLYNAK